MTIGDEVGGQTRWAVAQKALDAARKAIEGKSKDLDVKVVPVRRRPPRLQGRRPQGARRPRDRPRLDDAEGGQGRRRASRVASIVLLSDGASNGGISPLVAAQQLRAQTDPGRDRRRRHGRRGQGRRRTSPPATSSPGRPSSSRTSPRSAGRSRSGATPTRRSRSNSTSTATPSRSRPRPSRSPRGPRSSPSPA